MKNNRVNELDAQIKTITASTRTTFPALTPLHNWLRSKSKLYYNWHTNPNVSAIHLLVLTLILALFGVLAVTAVGGGLILGILYYFR